MDSKSHQLESDRSPTCNVAATSVAFEGVELYPLPPDLPSKRFSNQWKAKRYCGFNHAQSTKVCRTTGRREVEAVVGNIKVMMTNAGVAEYSEHC